MEYDSLFRIVMLFEFIIVIPIAAFYRIRSQLTKEKLDRRQEGLFLLIGIRVLAFLHMVGIVAFLIAPSNMYWSSLPLTLWLRWLGVAIASVAMFLWIWTFHHLGKNLTDTVVTRKNHTLITSGPYRWVRHPFYIAFLLLTLANTLTTANWFIFITGCLTFLLIFLRTRKEEANLILRFGDEYRTYMHRTGRFFPKIKL
jgi:protein-S-isoprenylcysteine O-methyltransferase Ste14